MQSVRAIVTRDQALLVMRRNKSGHQYYTLVGGGIDKDETPEQALLREVQEETGLEISQPRLVITQQGGGFGTQYIYQCEYIGGEPALDPSSTESQTTAKGENVYQPLWLPLDQLKDVNLLPAELKQAVISGLEQGFAQSPITLTLEG